MKRLAEDGIQTSTLNFQGMADVTSPLDVIVPFTTPELTRAAVAAAETLGSHLRSVIRLLAIHVVPFPLEIRRPDVNSQFLLDSLRLIRSALPVRRELILARDYETELRRCIGHGSVVVLAVHHTCWLSSTVRMAVRLRRSGVHIIIVRKEKRA